MEYRSSCIVCIRKGKLKSESISLNMKAISNYVLQKKKNPPLADQSINFHSIKEDIHL